MILCLALLVPGSSEATEFAVEAPSSDPAATDPFAGQETAATSAEVEQMRQLVHAHGEAELSLLEGAGHRLRHDPRAIAILLGWLDRMRSLQHHPSADTSSSASG